MRPVRGASRFTRTHHRIVKVCHSAGAWLNARRGTYICAVALGMRRSKLHFRYSLTRRGSRSTWVGCETFAQVPTRCLPSAGSILLVADGSLPHHGVDHLADVLRRMGPTLEMHTYAISAKDTMLLEELARDIGDLKPDLVYIAGGGTLCDVAGLAASLANPAIPTVLFPTTTVSMCDASVGGLTGLDRGGVKNAWSTRHLPVAVVACCEWLDTLPEDHLMSGFAEVVKMLFLSPRRQRTLAWLAACGGALLGRQADAVLKVVATGARIRACWAGSPRKRRRDLFGHGVGHALELELVIPHGEAVARGMLVEAAVAVRLEMLRRESYDLLLTTLSALGLPGAQRSCPWGPELTALLKRQRLYDGTNLHLALPTSSRLHPCVACELSPARWEAIQPPTPCFGGPAPPTPADSQIENARPQAPRSGA